MVGSLQLLQQLAWASAQTDPSCPVASVRRAARLGLSSLSSFANTTYLPTYLGQNLTVGGWVRTPLPPLEYVQPDESAVMFNTLVENLQMKQGWTACVVRGGRRVLLRMAASA